MDESRLILRSTPRAPTLRAADDGTPGRYLEGYGAVFNVESSLLFDDDVTDEDGDPIPFVEVIDPRAFDRTIRETPDILALFDHDRGKVLGSTEAKTLILSTDAIGLGFRDEIPETSAGRDARISVGRRDVKGCSFGGYVMDDRVEIRSGRPALRTLLDVELEEVTVGTAFPAYTGTQVALRARTERRRKGPTRDARSWISRERERLGLTDF